jgi:hypothetical protein
VQTLARSTSDCRLSLASITPPAVSDDGAAIVAWECEGAKRLQSVRAAVLPAGSQTWSAPQDVESAASTPDTGSPDDTIVSSYRLNGVAFDGAGAAHIAYQRRIYRRADQATAPNELRFADLPAGAGAWNPPVTVASAPSFLDAEALLMDRTGAALFVPFTAPLNRVFPSLGRAPDGSWTGFTDVPGSRNGSEPQMAFAAGVGVVIYSVRGYHGLSASVATIR